MKRKICIITGTRAEYGLFYLLLKEIESDPDLQLQIVATGMHLSSEFGLTYKLIEKDGFKISKKVEMLLSSDTPVGISKSMGLGVISFAETFEELGPDIIVLLGDRFETFSAAVSATVARIPIAHLHGGEITVGAIDEAFRHSITKMSHLHFTSTEEYRHRVIQLGEHPDRVFNVGAPGVETIRNLKLLSRKKLEKKINFTFGTKSVLVTYHPVTLENATSKVQFHNLLDALDSFSGLKIIFTKANADADGRVINSMIDSYVNNKMDNAVAFLSMGQTKYLSAMKYVNAVIGNSSSGIIEAPCLNTPTVNIGDRQKGRVRAASVIDCQPKKDAIIDTLNIVLSSEFKKSLKTIENPYNKDNTSLNIKETIKYFDLRNVIKKEFNDISFPK